MMQWFPSSLSILFDNLVSMWDLLNNPDLSVPYSSLIDPAEGSSIIKYLRVVSLSPLCTLWCLKLYEFALNSFVLSEVFT